MTVIWKDTHICVWYISCITLIKLPYKYINRPNLRMSLWAGLCNPDSMTSQLLWFKHSLQSCGIKKWQKRGSAVYRASRQANQRSMMYSVPYGMFTDLMVNTGTGSRLWEPNCPVSESVSTGCLDSGVTAPVQCSKHTAKVKAVRSCLTLKTMVLSRKWSFRIFPDDWLLISMPFLKGVH